MWKIRIVKTKLWDNTISVRFFYLNFATTVPLIESMKNIDKA